jgi:hypothetical protein
MEFITRLDLAKRWQTSTRTIDRKRRLGLLPWVDLAGGAGGRPIVRFRLSDIEDYEIKMLKKPMRPCL